MLKCKASYGSSALACLLSILDCFCKAPSCAKPAGIRYADLSCVTDAADSIAVNEATKAAELFRQSLNEQVSADFEMAPTGVGSSFTVGLSCCRQPLVLQELEHKSHRRTNSRFSKLKHREQSQRSQSAVLHQQVSCTCVLAT